MLKGVTLKTSLCSGHGSFPPRLPSSYSSDVFVNNQNIVRSTDTYNIHCDDESCHGGIATGSTTVFVNGLGVSSDGDSISCGSVASNGSKDVFIG